MKKPTAFISYSRKDQSIATRLAADLDSAGVSTWIDVKNISAGENWDSSIEKALTNSDFLLLLASPDSMNSGNVQDEWSYAISQNKPVIPVLVRPTTLPIRLHRKQYVDATNSELYPKALELILSIINEQVPLQISPEEARQQEKRIEESIEKTPEATILDKSEPASTGHFEQKLGVEVLLAEARKHHRNKATTKAVESYTQVLLDRGDPAFRIQAVTALGELRAASADLIQSLFDDPSPEVRRTVVRTLANFQSPNIIQALQVAAVNDDNLEVRLYAALVELYFKQPNQVTPWLNTLASGNMANLRAAANEAFLFANDLVKLSGHLFISYSRQDAEPFTLKLVEDLRTQEKFRVWVDTNLTPGTESWKKAIAKAIEQCSALLLILSPKVHESKWIGEEVSYAEQLGKDRFYVKYEQTHMPFGMSEMQGLRSDLSFKDYPEEMYGALIEELNRRNIPHSD